MIHRGHNCHPAEPVVVSIEGVETPERRAFVSALVQVMNSFCTARMQTDRDVLHAPAGCPDVVLETGQGNSRHCMLRIFPGPQDSPSGDAAKIAVLDPQRIRLFRPGWISPSAGWATWATSSSASVVGVHWERAPAFRSPASQQRVAGRTVRRS